MFRAPCKTLFSLPITWLIMAPPQLELVRGLEKQFAVNHLGHFLLVHRLLDAVRPSSPAASSW